MANTKSAAKHARTSLVRRQRNNAVKSELKTRTRTFRASISAGDKEAATKAYTALSSRLDSAAKRGVIHKNAANRSKSRIAKALALLKA
ncbi:MAG: 30S ribosomal protein S20 [Verrucomicrobiia bacterium]